MKVNYRQFFSVLVLALASIKAHSADLKRGEELFRPCTLCHGQLGQGIKDGLYPRIANLPDYYTLHQLELFTSEKRFNLGMVTVGNLHTLTEKDKENLADYIDSIKLGKAELDIPLFTGDAEAGEELYDDCKTCHGKKGEGKRKKETPPLAGQYSKYLLRQIEFFKEKSRLHDNDIEDDTFDDYTDEEIINILTYISTLDD